MSHLFLEDDDFRRSVSTGNLVLVKQILNEYEAGNTRGKDKGRTGSIKALLNSKDMDNRNLLHYACLYNTNDVATWLFLTMKTKNVDVTQKDTMGASPVLYAAKAGMVGFVEEWIK